MLLSPLATPFQPAFSAPTGVVFNNGVPSMVASEHDIVQGYPDAVLDENFPPSAQEAAELEAVETFVDILATLSVLEEREEKARSSFCHVKKRWESRREDGLVGKPRQAKGIVDAVDHANVGRPLRSSDLVPFAHSNRALATELLQSRQRSRDEFRRANSRGDKRAHHQPRPLQQPRKQN